MRRKYKTQKELFQAIFSNTLSVLEGDEAGGGSSVETPEVANDDTAPKVVVEPTEEADPSAQPETPVEGEGEGEGDEAELPEAAQVEDVPIAFDVEDELPVLTEKLTALKEKYDFDDLPVDFKTAIEVLTAKAESVNNQFEVYGEPESVKTTLDTYELLHSVRNEETGLRRNTDQFIAKIDAETQDLLTQDLLKAPSTLYPTLTKAQEFIAQTFAQPGDTVGMVLQRYNDNVKQLLANQVVASGDVPSFIPPHLIQAYKSQSALGRQEWALVDPEYDAEYPDTVAKRADKLQDLARIQDGLNAVEAQRQRDIADRQTRQQAFTATVQGTVEKFYDTFRSSVMADMAKNVQFSPDAKLNTLYAYQNVSMLEKAIAPEGGAYRDALKEAGINLDFEKAIQLDLALGQSVIVLETAKSMVDATGKQLNPVGLSKATAGFVEATKNYQKFANDIITQQKNLIAPKTKEAIQEEAKKVKVAPKPRVVASGKAQAMAHKTESNPHPYNSLKWHEWLVDRELEDQAKRARAYA